MEIVGEPLASDVCNLKGSYPNLIATIGKNGTVDVEGIFDVCADDKHIDSFSIRIEIPPDYPMTVPRVFETGGKIPRIADRHINPDGSACLFVPDARWKHWPPGSDLVRFVSGPVYYYFLGQAFYDLEGRWLFGERPHGDDGVIDYYKEELGLNSLGAVYKCLKVATSGRSGATNRNRLCVCGGGKAMEQCHKEKISLISENIPRQRLFEVMAMLKRRR